MRDLDHLTDAFDGVFVGLWVHLVIEHIYSLANTRTSWATVKPNTPVRRSSSKQKAIVAITPESFKTYAPPITLSISPTFCGRSS